MTDVMSPTLTLRPATESDKPWLESAMAALQDHEASMIVGLRPGHKVAAQEVARAFKLVAQRDGLLLIAEQDGEAVGYIGAVPKLDEDPLVDQAADKHVFITDLFIAEGYRGRGIGRALLQAVETHFAKSGYRQLRIGAVAANRPARQLYESLGYTAREVLYEKSIEVNMD